MFLSHVFNQKRERAPKFLTFTVSVLKSKCSYFSSCSQSFGTFKATRQLGLPHVAEQLNYLKMKQPVWDPNSTDGVYSLSELQ